MTTVYPDSTIGSFNLYDFFYGCTSGTETSLTALAAACQIKVTGTGTGTGTDGKVEGSQTFSPDPGTALSAQMVEAKSLDPKIFTGLQSATFEIVNPLSLLLAGLVDNVNYTVFERKPIPN